MVDSEIIAAVRNKYQALKPVMDEKVRRCWAACEAVAIGWGGITVVSEATGISRPTIRAGIAEMQSGAPAAKEVLQRRSIRRVGGGRRCLSETDPTLLKDLQTLLESSTRGDPQSPLRWSSKSTRHLADALRRQGHVVSPTLLPDCLMRWTTAYKAIGRRVKAVLIRIAMPNLTTSINTCGRFRNAVNRWSRLTPKRRKGWAISRMPGGNGIPRANRRRCAARVFLTKRLAKVFRMVSMTSVPTRAG